MKKDIDSIANWLRGKRENLGLGTDDLSKICRIDQSHISRIETGKLGLTLNALVNLCWVLGIDNDELAKETGTPRLIEHKAIIKNKEMLSDKIFIYDLEAAYRKYYARQDDTFFQFIAQKFHQAYKSASKSTISYEFMEKRVRQAVVYGLAMPAPTRTTPDFLWDYYVENAVVTLSDTGLYLRLLREAKKLTIDDFSEKTHMAKSILSRIEQGQTERLGVKEINLLDDELGAEGRVFSMFWQAIEFKQGICRNRFFSSGQERQKPYVWSAYPLVDIFVKLARWTEQYSSLEWLHEFRNEAVYHQVINSEPIDYFDGNNLEELSKMIFDPLKPALPYLLNADDDVDNVFEREMAIFTVLQELWQCIEGKFSKHPLGKYVLEVLKVRLPNDDYYGTFKFALQEMIRDDAAFRASLTEFVKKIPADQPAPVWKPDSTNWEN